MKKLLLLLPLAAALAGCPLAQTTAPSGSSAAAPATTTGSTSMLAQLPAFLGKLDSLRGSALSVAEKATVTSAVTQGSGVLDGIQNKFLGAIASTTGLDASMLGAIIPSATQPVSNSALTSGLESKLGKKLNFLQSSSVTAANTLRNNSLDGLKTSLTNGVASKVGMDPTLISSLLPMLGF